MNRHRQHTLLCSRRSTPHIRLPKVLPHNITANQLSKFHHIQFTIPLRQFPNHPRLSQPATLNNAPPVLTKQQFPHILKFIPTLVLLYLAILSRLPLACELLMEISSPACRWPTRRHTQTQTAQRLLPFSRVGTGADIVWRIGWRLTMAMERAFAKGRVTKGQDSHSSHSTYLKSRLKRFSL